MIDETFQVAKATATVTLDTASLDQTYDGTVKAVTATTSPPGLGLTFAYSQGGHPVTSPVAAGIYNVTATNLDPNYQGSVTGTLTIAQATQQLTFLAPSDKTYGDVAFSLSASASSGLPVQFEILSGPATISGSTLTITGAGDVVVEVDQPGDSNTKPASIESSFTVHPAPLTIQTKDVTRVYSAPNPTFDVSYLGLVNADGPNALNGSAWYATTATATSDVGQYDVTPGGLVSSNYAISFQPGKLSVTPAPLLVTIANGSKTYGQDDAGSLTGAISGVQNGDAISAAFVSTGSATTADVGSYSITAHLTGAKLNDYALAIHPGILSVTPAPLTIRAVDQAKVYGAGLPLLSYRCDGFVNGETYDCLSVEPHVSTTATTSCHVGNYPITASGAAAPNYTITYQSGTLRVTPATLTITAPSVSKVYGAAVPHLTPSFSGFVSGDSQGCLKTQPSCATTATNRSHVVAGGYPITLAGASATDYTIRYVNGTLTVTPAPLTITADNETMTQGGAVPTLTASYAGFVNGDGPSVLNPPVRLSTTATKSSAAGKYAITASAAASPDYAITLRPGTLTVTPRATPPVVTPPTVFGYWNWAQWYYQALMARLAMRWEMALSGALVAVSLAGNRQSRQGGPMLIPPNRTLRGGWTTRVGPAERSTWSGSAS